MDFRSLNKFNLILNTLSGNFFPITGEKKKLSLGATIYSSFAWIVEMTWVISAVIGSIRCVPLLTSIQQMSVPYMLVLEVIILSIHYNSRRGQLHDLIRMMNRLLIDDDDLKRCLTDTVDPHQRLLKQLAAMTAIITVSWALGPIGKIFKFDEFTCDDFTVAAYLPGEPFTPKVFVWGVLLQLGGAIYITLKKVSLDVYISYLITVLTAEYKYVRHRIVVALSREHYSEQDPILVNAALRKCIIHHCAVIETGQMLVNMMALQVGVTYMNGIIRFCFLAFSYVSCDDYYNRIIYLVYACGCVIQVHTLCHVTQNLLDASTSVTDDAFYEDWHDRRSDTRKIFAIIELSNHMECRLTAFSTVDLTVPSLGTIINQAYSAFLILRNTTV